MWNIARPSGALLSIITIVLLIVALKSNSFSTLDNTINDLLITYSLKPKAIHNTVIIKVPEIDIDKPYIWWHHLLTQINSGKPRLIAFNFVPVNAYEAIQSRLTPVIFSNRIHQHYFENERYYPAYNGIEKDALILNTPFTSDRNLYRHAVATARLGQNHYPTLTNTIAMILTGKAIDESAFLYFNDSQDIPQLRSENVYKGKINPTLFNNRVVLLDIGRSIPEARIDTPLDKSVSLSQFQAIVINSIVNQSWLYKLNNTWSLLIALAIFITGILCFSRLRNIYCLAMTALLILIFISLEWLCLHYLKLMLPVSSMIVGLLLSLTLAMGYRQSHASKSLERLAHESSRHKTLYLPNTIRQSNSAKNFDDINQLIYNLLPINQSVFMQRMPDDCKLKFVNFMACTRADVIERRRDFNRSPFLDASRTGKSIPLNIPFLDQHDDRQQYMAPLIFAHQLLGFWVYSLDTSVDSVSDTLLSLFDKTACEIAESLYHRQYQQPQKSPPVGSFKRSLFFASSNHAHALLQSTLEARDKHAQLALAMLENSTAATIAYDSMGQVMYANKTAEHLFKNSDIRLYETPVLTLLNQLANLSLPEARQHFQYVTMNHKAVSIPVTNLSFLNDYTISLKALIAENHNDNHCLFGLNGILMELTDLKNLNTTYKLRDNVLEQFIFNLNTRLGTMTMALRQMADSDNAEQRQKDLLSVLQRQLSMSFNATTRIQKTLQKANSDLAINVYPIDTLFMVNQCINNIVADLHIRDIRITTDFPARSTLALADHSRFSEIINNLLALLAQNAAELTVITVAMREYNQQDRFIEYQFKTTGFGMANGQLQSFIDNNKNTSSNTMQHIIKATQEIENWGGSLTLVSEFGEGISATLTLKGYCTYDDITS